MQVTHWDSSPRTERRVEQRITEHGVDIKRLWKRLVQLEASQGLPPGNGSGTGGVLPGIGGGSGGSGTTVGLGKTDSSVSAGGTVVVSIYTPGASGGLDTDSGSNVTCYCRTDIDSGLFVNYIDRGDYYECFPLECNA